MATDVAPLGLNRKAQAISCSHGSEAIAVGHRMAPAKAGSGACSILTWRLWTPTRPAVVQTQPRKVRISASNEGTVITPLPA